MIVKILWIIYDCLTNNRVITKRDLYYQDVRIFGRQRAADEMVAAIAFSLKVESVDIGIVAAQKGLVFGELVVHYGKDKVEIAKANGPSLIPPTMTRCTSILLPKSVKYALIIEKEVSEYSTLIDSITNKGGLQTALLRC